MSAAVLQWVSAAAPIALLLVLVLRSRLSTGLVAVITAVAAVVISVTVFGATAEGTAVATGKGLWTGLWILYVVWPALLLYRVATAAGLDRMGGPLSSILPTETENVLIVAWILPSFVQGVAGFGTPIAVAAPMLLSMGLSPVAAVALPVIGYQWSVTFGSMGSSYFMAGLTAELGDAALQSFAVQSAALLSVNLMVAGALVCVMHGGLAGLRRGLRLILTAGPVMAATLIGTALIQPAVASLASATSGLLVVLALRYLHRSRRATSMADDAGGVAVPRARTPRTGGDRGGALIAAAPYAALLVVVLAVFVPGPTRELAANELLIGPAFPQTETSLGHVNEATARHTPIALLGHPGTYVLVATAIGLLIYRLRGVRLGGARPLLTTWLRQARSSTMSILGLTTLAAVMVDSGMIRAIASGAGSALGGAYPVIAPLIGGMGSFTTGSTTTSNALLAALQRDVATIIGVAPETMLAAQTAGGNVGNALTPVVIVIGAVALGAEERVSEMLRAALRPAAVLMAVVTAATCVLVYL